MAKSRSAFGRILAWIAVLVLLICGVAAGVTGYWYLGPYRGFATETFVEIEHGMSSRGIAEVLAQHGVVRSSWAFLAVRFVHPRAPLQAGEYRFGSAVTPMQAFDMIRRGQVFYEEFTVPEGSNMFDIAGLLKQSDTVKPDDFLKAAADPELIRDLDPQAPHLEGYLFPSTYRVSHRTTGRQLCRMMTAEFRKQWNALSGNQSADVHKTVTMASLVEKEAGLAQERPLVASVFMNRLRENIPLQCDPTTVYAALLENRWAGVIHRSDLANRSLYNTYAHTGLPPGPIANPGVASLTAALHPAQSEYRYFVAKADGSGSHHFSDTLAEHQKAVTQYRRNAQAQ